jgi:hypothetical protein
MGRLYGCAGRLNTKNTGLRPGQRGMHMISASAPSDLAEYVDEGTLNPGTSLVTPAGMLVMQGNVAALRRALDARECTPDDSASSPGHA